MIKIIYKKSIYAEKGSINAFMLKVKKTFTQKNCIKRILISKSNNKSNYDEKDLNGIYV